MSRFELGLEEARRRLEDAVQPDSWRILEYALRRKVRGSDVVLWVDEEWDSVPFEDLEVDEGIQVGCAVFTEPLTFEGLDLRDERLLGYFQGRDSMVWVFLSEVCCSVFTTLPDTVAVFAGGLAVEGIANFAAPDATTLVEKKLAADVVLSGMGDSSVMVVPGCALAIRAFHSYLSSAGKLEQILPASMVEELEDASAWEVVSELLD